MKGRWALAPAVALTVLLLLLPGGGSAAAADSLQDETGTARKAAQSFVSSASAAAMYPRWQSATLDGGQACYDVQDRLIAFMFTVTKDNEAVGRIVVGGSAYRYHVLEASQAPFPPFPTEAELKSAVKRDLGIEVPDVAPGSLKLRYLGYCKALPSYEPGGQPVAFDLWHRKAFLASQLAGSMVTPEQYAPATQEGGGAQILTWVDWNNLAVPSQIMFDYEGYTGPWQNDCGPTSGAMASEYYKQNLACSGFPNWADDHHELYDDMDCDPWWYPGTLPGNAWRGFVTYASRHGYAFSGEDYIVVDPDWYGTEVKPRIDSGDPMMVLFLGGPYTGGTWHWCTLRGYGTWQETGVRYVFVNNPWYDSGNGDSVDWEANYGSMAMDEIWPTNEYTLTLSTSGSGTVARFPDLPSYINGVTVQLTATAAQDWHFVNWSGDTGTIADPNSASTTITMNGNYTVQANFAYSPTVRGVLQGGSRPYPTGFQVPLALRLYDPSLILDVNNIMTAEWLYEYTSDGGDIEIFDINQSTKTIRFRVLWDCPEATYHVTLWDTHVAPWDHTLINLRNSVTFSPSLTEIDMETLQEGNAKEDVQINIDDFTMLLNDYLSYPGQPNWNDGRCDFDHTLQVTSLDYSLLSMNYNEYSPVVVGGGQLRGEETFGKVDMSLKIADAASLSVGKTFLAAIQVKADAQSVDGVDVFLTFDPACIEVVSIKPGSALGEVLASRFDNAAGTITLSLGRDLNAGPASGTFTLGTIGLRAKAASKGTILAFEQKSPRQTEAAYHGEPLLGSATGLTVEVKP